MKTKRDIFTRQFLMIAMLFTMPRQLLAMEQPTADRAEQLEYDPQTGKWIEIEPPEPGTAEGDLALARKELAVDNISKSRKAYRKWLKNYGEGHALARDARLGLAAVELADRNYYKAHKILTELTAEFGTDEVTREAVELEFIIAEAFLTGQKRKWLGMRMLSAEDLGIKILDDVTADYPDSAMAENALKTKADYYFDRGDFDLAEDEYTYLINTFPRSQWLLVANLRRAEATLARFPGTKFDDASLIEAEERFFRLRAEFPQAIEAHRVDLVLEDIRNRRAQKDFETGQYYVRIGKPSAGAFYFRSVLEQWPATLAATRAEAELIEMGQMYEPPAELGLSNPPAGSREQHLAANH